MRAASNSSTATMDKVDEHSGGSSSSAATSSSDAGSERAEPMQQDDCGEQPLQTPWTFWFDRATGAAYTESLQRLGTVHTVQGFWRYYCNLNRPAQLSSGDNYHLFRGALQPAQEMLPNGGCWCFRIRSGKVATAAAAAAASDGGEAGGEQEVNMLWEKLLLCLVGETIGEPCVAGAGVSVRNDESVIAVWCREAQDAGAHKRVGEQLEHHVFGDGAIEYRAIRAKPPPAAAASAPPAASSPPRGAAAPATSDAASPPSAGGAAVRPASPAVSMAESWTSA